MLRISFVYAEYYEYVFGAQGAVLLLRDLVLDIILD